MTKRRRGVDSLSSIKAKKYISASQLRNYVRGDAIIDWLSRKRRSKTRETNTFQSWVIEQGNKFEKNIVDFINRFKVKVYTIGTEINEENCRLTKIAVEKRVPVIYSAPFKDDEYKIQGVIDLLINVDYISQIFDTNPLPITESNYYIPFDIKYKTLNLFCDGKTVSNCIDGRFYKTQLLVYCQALKNIQGFSPRYAGVLGRRWRYTVKDEPNTGHSLERFGLVDFESVDASYKNSLKEAIEWLKKLEEDGDDWKLSPPSVPELYPNMHIDSGSKWNAIKRKLAEKNGEITQLWYCTVKHRMNAISNGVDRIDDPRLNSKILGFNGSRSRVLDEIISINRSETEKIRPVKVKSNIFDWRVSNNDVFVDFETFTDVLTTVTEQDGKPISDVVNNIFLIGVYHPVRGKYKYTYFRAKNTSLEEEYRVMSRFLSLLKRYENPNVWFWHAEPGIWNSRENFQLDTWMCRGDEKKCTTILNEWKLNEKCNLCDMAVLFRSEPIVVKGAYNFSLKNIAKAMYKHRMIRTKLESSTNNGMDASINAWKSYQTGDKRVFADVVKYNSFDVKVLYDILNYLRTNH